MVAPFPSFHSVGGRPLDRVSHPLFLGTSFRECTENGVSVLIASMTGDSSIDSGGGVYENALMETTNALFENEYSRTRVVHDGPSKTTADIESVAAGWA